ARKQKAPVDEHQDLVPQPPQRRDQIVRERLETGIETTRKQNPHVRLPSWGGEAEPSRPRPPVNTEARASASSRPRAPLIAATSRAVPQSRIPSGSRRRNASGLVAQHSLPRALIASLAAPPA